MKRRGRPPHPDILTPREWEALELVRQGLTNDQIAQRLGISMDGAKYHVSEILSKLGVSSRQEAAAWQPAAARPWWAAGLAPVGWLLQRLTLSAAMKAGGASVVVAAAGGLALLGWAVLTVEESEEAGIPRSQMSPVPGSVSDLERDTADTRALMERFAAAYEDRDADAIAALFASDGRWDAITSGGTHLQSPNSIRAGFRDWFTNVLPPNRIFEYKLLIADEHMVVGTWSDEWSADGKTERLDGITVFEVDDGEIVRGTNYYDSEPVEARLR